MAQPAKSMRKTLATAVRNVVAITVELIANFALPFAIYTVTKSRLGDVHALMAATSAPIAWSVIEFIRKRRVDALSIIVLAGIGLSLVAVAGGGSPRFLQLRETLVGGIIGVVFLASAAIGKPLIYYLARARIRRRSTSEADVFEAARDDAILRSTMMTLTVVWGIGLVVGTAVCAGLVFSVSIETYLLLGPTIGYGAIALLTLWTYWFARRKLTGLMRSRKEPSAAAG